MKNFYHTWMLVAAILLLHTAVGAVNINGNGISLNLVTTDLSSSGAQTNGTDARLLYAGTPDAAIVSTNAAGAKIIIEPMMVINAEDTPIADFSATPLTGGAPLEVQFFDLSAEGLYEILAWTWDFGDGSPYSSDQNPVHTYDVPGIFTVSLTILTTGGTDQVARQDYVTVVQAIPSAGRAALLLIVILFVSAGIIVIRNKRFSY